MQMYWLCQYLSRSEPLCAALVIGWWWEWAEDLASEAASGKPPAFGAPIPESLTVHIIRLASGRSNFLAWFLFPFGSRGLSFQDNSKDGYVLNTVMYMYKQISNKIQFNKQLGVDLRGKRHRVWIVVLETTVQGHDHCSLTRHIEHLYLSAC